jgi:hypothetical protein
MWMERGDMPFRPGVTTKSADSQSAIRSERERAIRSRIARRRAEPGWRAAVLDERESRHALSSASE